MWKKILQSFLHVGTFFSFHHHQGNVTNIATYTSPQMHANKSITYTDANALPTLLFHFWMAATCCISGKKNISLLQEPSGTVNNIAGWLLGSYSPMAAWIGYRCCMVNALEVGCVVQVQQGIDQEGPCGSSRSLWKLSLRQGSSATDLWHIHGRSQPHPLYDKPFWCSLLHLCI